MKYLTILVLSTILFLSCSENSSSPGDEFITDFHLFTVNQVDYDSLQIESQNSIKCDEQSVEKISLFVEDSGVYVFQDSMTPTYLKEEDYYYLNFQFNIKVARSIRDLNYRIQFLLTDETVVEIDSTHLMLTYPYQNAQLYLTADEVYSEYTIFFQDIDLNGDVLYFHPTSALGLYEYVYATQQTTELYWYSGGDYIAHDSNYVFLDISRTSIYRYNTETDSIDLNIDLSSISYDQIAGIECWQNNLYVLFRYSSGNFIAKFNYQGSFISSIPYGRNTYFLTIESGIAYSHNYKTTLSRFDLGSGQFLSDKLMPATGGEGIRIYDGKFYYVDWDKRIIGVFPLSDL